MLLVWSGDENPGTQALSPNTGSAAGAWLLLCVNLFLLKLGMIWLLALLTFQITCCKTKLRSWTWKCFIKKNVRWKY